MKLRKLLLTTMALSVGVLSLASCEGNLELPSGNNNNQNDGNDDYYEPLLPGNDDSLLPGNDNPSVPGDSNSGSSSSTSSVVVKAGGKSVTVRPTNSSVETGMTIGKIIDLMKVKEYSLSDFNQFTLKANTNIDIDYSYSMTAKEMTDYDYINDKPIYSDYLYSTSRKVYSDLSFEVGLSDSSSSNLANYIDDFQFYVKANGNYSNYIDAKDEGKYFQDREYENSSIENLDALFAIGTSVIDAKATATLKMVDEDGVSRSKAVKFGESAKKKDTLDVIAELDDSSYNDIMDIFGSTSKITMGEILDDEMFDNAKSFVTSYAPVLGAKITSTTSSSFTLNLNFSRLALEQFGVINYERDAKIDKSVVLATLNVTFDANLLIPTKVDLDASKFADDMSRYAVGVSGTGFTNIKETRKVNKSVLKMSMSLTPTYSNPDISGTYAVVDNGVIVFQDFMNQFGFGIKK